MKKLLILVTFGLLIGCGGPVKYRVKEVNIPIIQECPVIEYPSLGPLPISQLTPESTISETGRAYYISVILMKDHINILENYIDLYNTQKAE